MECPKCQAPIPDDKSYCSDCGAQLKSSPEDSLKPELRQQVQAVLKEQFKDQKVVEVEIMETIVTRLSNWAKLFGYFVGIPFGILIVILGFLGIKTVSDLHDVTQRIDQAKQQADEVSKTGDGLLKEYEQLRGRLAQYKDLDERVNQIEEKLNIKNAESLPPGLKDKLNSSFHSFQQYFQKLGFKSKTGQIDVEVSPNKENESDSYFDTTRNVFVFGVPLASDPDVVARAYTFYALGTFGKDFLGTSQIYNGIQSGLADYFPASFSNDPQMGEASVPFFRSLNKEAFNKPYIRTLSNNRKFTDVSLETDEIHDAGEIWGAAFWDIRENNSVGKEMTDKLLFSTWASLQPSDLRGNQAMNFINKLIETDKALAGGQHADAIRSAFQKRGL
jgi:uncharacterized protein YoxC